MKCLSFKEQIHVFEDIIKNIVLENMELFDSIYVDEADKTILESFKYLKSDFTQLKLALKTLSRCLYQHYNQKVMIIIDEYDVPLQAPI